MLIRRKVLETFTYALDGRTPRLMRAGKFYPFKADDAARFEREGYLEAPAGEKTARPKRSRKAT